MKGNPVQGNPLFVTVTAEPEQSVEVEWVDLKIPKLKTDKKGSLRFLVPVPVDTKTGSHSLQVKLGQAEEGQPEAVVLSKKIVVTHRPFPTQYLTIPASTLASYDNPQNKADDKAILDSMKPFDRVQHWSTQFSIPVEARESTGFGQKRLYNGWKKGWHKGLDLAGWEGQPVLAPGGAKVLHTARGIVNGNTVVLGHGMGLATVYMHLNSIDVQAGSGVEEGHQIGTVGGTGGFAPHLHWEARVWGVPIDPKSLFSLPEGFR